MKFSRLISFLIFGFACTITSAQENWKFEFGKETHAVSTNIITENVRFSNETGFGFDIENQDHVRIVSPADHEPGYCTADVPFYFSAKVPEGTYEVIILAGNPVMPSELTVKAEARRLMIDRLALEKGETAELKFTVSVRSPLISEGKSIQLKPREENYMNWDNRLSLEFSGTNQAILKIEIRPKKNYTTIFLAGNSTVTDQDREPWASWGQMITPYFDQSVSVANYAESGESLASFKASGRLDKVLSMMKPGDYLFIEFGHNDQKRKGEGIGPWTSYTDLLKEFIIRSREKGGIPVLLTPTQRRSFNKRGRIEYTHGDYPDAMRKVAREMDVPLIDLNRMTKKMYESWGPDDSKKAFVHYPEGTFPGQESALEDNTHFNSFGAHEIALCVLSGIMENELDIDGTIIHFKAPYDPHHPNRFSDWHLPMSPRFISKKTEGN